MTGDERLSLAHVTLPMLEWAWSQPEKRANGDQWRDFCVAMFVVALANSRGGLGQLRPWAANLYSSRGLL